MKKAMTVLILLAATPSWGFSVKKEATPVNFNHLIHESQAESAQTREDLKGLLESAEDWQIFQLDGSFKGKWMPVRPSWFTPTRRQTLLYNAVATREYAEYLEKHMGLELEDVTITDHTQFTVLPLHGQQFEFKAGPGEALYAHAEVRRIPFQKGA